MAMFKTLAEFQKNTVDRINTSSNEDRVQRYFSLKSGESFKIRFRQELTEDAANYDDEIGGAHTYMVHTNPNNFTKHAVCTADNDEWGYKCWACEQVKATSDNAWKAKQRLVINIAVQVDGDNGEKVWVPRVLDQKFTPAHCASDVVEFASAYDTLTDRVYKISRTGEKKSTNYSLIPLNVEDAPAELAELPVHDLSKMYRTVSYAEQAGFFLETDDKSPAEGWGSD